MPQADGRNSLHRMAFVWGSKQFRFAINPQKYDEARPQRTALLKSKDGTFVQDFSQDIPTITISGTTGFQNGRGSQQMRALKDFLEEYANAGGNGRRAVQPLYFYNFTDDEFFAVHLTPEGVNYHANAENPLVRDYTINMVVLREARQADASNKVEPVIGNYTSSISANARSVNPSVSPSAIRIGSDQLKSTIGQW